MDTPLYYVGCVLRTQQSLDDVDTFLHRSFGDLGQIFQLGMKGILFHIPPSMILAEARLIPRIPQSIPIDHLCQVPPRIFQCTADQRTSALYASRRHNLAISCVGYSACTAFTMTAGFRYLTERATIPDARTADALEHRLLSMSSPMKISLQISSGQEPICLLGQMLCCRLHLAPIRRLLSARRLLTRGIHHRHRLWQAKPYSPT